MKENLEIAPLLYLIPRREIGLRDQRITCDPEKRDEYGYETEPLHRFISRIVS
jgi:hypothetical protein